MLLKNYGIQDIKVEFQYQFDQTNLHTFNHKMSMPIGHLPKIVNKKNILIFIPSFVNKNNDNIFKHFRNCKFCNCIIKFL